MSDPALEQAHELLNDDYFAAAAKIRHILVAKIRKQLKRVRV